MSLEFPFGWGRERNENVTPFIFQEKARSIEGEMKGGSYSARTHRGKNPHKENEDAFLAVPEKGIFVVADGVGGVVAGEVASLEAVSTIANLVKQNKIDFSDTESLLRSILKRYRSLSENDLDLREMATTLAGFSVIDNRLRTFHIGDSRIYVFDSNGHPKYISRDDSQIQVFIDNIKKVHGVGPKSIKEKANDLEASFLNKNLILSCVQQNIGLSERISTSLIKIDDNSQLTNEGRVITSDKTIIDQEIELEPGDIVMACSDGLNDELTQLEIQELIKKYSDNVARLGEVLEQEALQHGGLDNITLTLYKHGK